MIKGQEPGWSVIRNVRETETESVEIAGKERSKGTYPIRWSGTAGRAGGAGRGYRKREKEKLGFCSGAQTNPTWTRLENEAASETNERKRG